LGQVRQYAVDAICEIGFEATKVESHEKVTELYKHAGKSLSDRSLRAMISSAEFQPEVACLIEGFDQYPMLLNVANGVLDLETSEIMSHDPNLMLTQISPVFYDPAATCPTFLQFLDTVMGGDDDVIRFLQKATGYSLTARTDEECMFILHGTGANGKSTFLETTGRLLGNYAQHTPTETLMVTRNESISNDVARLRGARLVTAAETETGQYLAEAKIKQMVGCDTISARFLHREYFDFEPKFKIWMSCNHKPKIKGGDEGIWRRLRLVPFDVQIPPEQRDPSLKGQNGKLAAELPGILNWALEGLQMWLDEGLKAPARVSEATATYRSDSDAIRAFVEDRCRVDVTESERVSDMFEAYRNWCFTNGETCLGKRAFGNRLRESGHDSESRGGRQHWIGIGLLPKNDDEQDSSTIIRTAPTADMAF
jgi:putative DNA primase/helicase